MSAIGRLQDIISEGLDDELVLEDALWRWHTAESEGRIRYYKEEIESLNAAIKDLQFSLDQARQTNEAGWAEVERLRAEIAKLRDKHEGGVPL